MGDLDSDTKESIREASKQIKVLNNRVETQYQKNQIKQQAQASENAHFLVSLAVLSGIITYYFRNGGLDISSKITGQSGPFDTILLISTISVSLFIPLKLLLTTLRPVTDSEWLNKLNNIGLPAINVFLVVSLVPLLAIYAFYPEYQLEYFTIKYIGMALVLSIVPWIWYLPKYQEAMKKVRATSTRRNIIVTFQPGNSDGKVRLTNPNSRSIPGEEVKFQVDVPEDVYVEIGQIKGNPNEEEELELAVELPGNSVMDLPVTIDPADSDPNGEIDIRVNIGNQPTQTTTISYGVDSDHSGTTNIG